jgi:carbon-monoxide dehydrogenase large subunit
VRHSALRQAEDHYTCYTTSQNPHVARLVMSAFYNVAPENKLRVIAPDVGGGFGSKIFIYPEEIVCLWASKKTGVRSSGRCGPHREPS